MENSFYVVPFIVMALTLFFFISGVRQRLEMNKELKRKEDLIKLKETEFNELRLFTAGVTHEINNGLTIVMGRTSQLIKKNEDPELEKILNNIYSSSERIAESVAGLRQVIYPDKFETEEVIELAELKNDVLKLIGQRLRNHGIELKLKGLEHKVIKGRRGQLEQLIINLLNQSIEILRDLEDKWIQIVAVEEQGKLNIYFMDSSGKVGDKMFHKQYRDILENNHGHLIVNQNNFVLELPQEKNNYHF